MSCDWLRKLHALVFSRAEKPGISPSTQGNWNPSVTSIATAVTIVQLCSGLCPSFPFSTGSQSRYNASYALCQQRLNTPCPDASLISEAIARSRSTFSRFPTFLIFARMSTLFGQPANPKPNLFGSLNTNTNSSGLFGQPASSSNSAPGTQAPSGGSLFDRVTPAPSNPTNSIFGSQTQSSSQPTTNIFGAPNQQSQAPSGSNIFGATLGGLGSNNQQQQQGTQPAGSLFGGSTLLGGNSNPFGGSTQQNSAGGFLGGLGQSSNQQSQQSNSLFGGLGQNAQQQQQVPQQPVPYGTFLPPRFPH